MKWGELVKESNGQRTTKNENEVAVSSCLKGIKIASLCSILTWIVCLWTFQGISIYEGPFVETFIFHRSAQFFLSIKVYWLRNFQVN